MVPKWPRDGRGHQRARRGEGADPVDPRRSPRITALGRLTGNRRLATMVAGRGLRDFSDLADTVAWGGAAPSDSESEGRAKPPSVSESEGSGGNADMGSGTPRLWASDRRCSYIRGVATFRNRSGSQRERESVMRKAISGSD